MLPAGLVVEPTRDFPRVASVMLDERVVAETEPGFGRECSPRLLAGMLADEGNHFFGFRHEGEPGFRGVFPFFRVNEVTVEIHGYVLPEFRGHFDSVEAARWAVRWLFEHTGVRKVQAFIASCHRGPLRHAERVGLKFEGYSPDSFLRDGKWFGRFLLGLTAPERKG